MQAWDSPASGMASSRCRSAAATLRTKLEDFHLSSPAAALRGGEGPTGASLTLEG